jgi:MFS transporter, DHA1 family, inner membrane transport protein
MAGLLVTLFAPTVATAGPFLTARLVGYEQKKLFIFTLLLFALSNLVAAGASNIWVMALARFIPALMLPVFWSPASDTRVVKAAEGRPALGASLNISGGNIGIALGAFTESRVIDLFGLASVGLAGAVIIVAAMAAALSLVTAPNRLP